MKRLIVRRAAEHDAEAARDWYEVGAELGEAFIAELRSSLDRLRYLSNRFPEVRRGVRRCLMNRFPYAIYFVVHDLEVIVLAILHLRRAPSALDKRLADEDAV